MTTNGYDDVEARNLNIDSVQFHVYRLLVAPSIIDNLNTIILGLFVRYKIC